MAAENKLNQEEKLSPEEKLLKVIQSGGQTVNKQSPEEKLANVVKQTPPPEPKEQNKPSEATSVPNLSNPHLVPPKRTGMQEMQKQMINPEPPKLRLTKISANQEKEREAKAAALAKVMIGQKTVITSANISGAAKKGVEAAPLSETSAGKIKMAGKLPKLKKEENGNNFFAVIGRFVAAGIILVIGISGYEIWGAVKWEGEFRKSMILDNAVSANNPVAQMEVYPDPYILEDLQKSFVEKNLFGVAPENKPRPMEQQTAAVTAGHIEEALKNLQLIGHSKLGEGMIEGIVLDKKENKMYFLKKGDKFLFNSEELDVIEIFADRLVIKKGNATSVIK